MGCSCGQRRGSASAKVGETLGYIVTRPDGSESGTYLTVIDAKMDVREHGGGTIRRKVRAEADATSAP